MKRDHANDREWRYTYDLDDPAAYDTANNRQMKVEEFTGQGPGAVLAKTSWYVYNCAGNVTRVVSRDESVGAGFGSGGGEVGRVIDPAKRVTMQTQGAKGGGAVRVPPGGCPAGSSRYTATRFGYALNGQSVTLAMGEEWCWDDPFTSNPTTDYAVTWAHEFLSDGARQRFLDIELDPAALTGGTFTESARTLTEYDGDRPYKSRWTEVGTGAYSETGYELGLARINDLAGAPQTSYYHTDMLGTTRFMTDSAGVTGEQTLYTAFGERVSGSATRFGYVGAFGYENTKSSTGQEGMPYLHVGARYYDPTTGRFFQRDPIGIRGGLNVYAYVLGIPTVSVDPDGMKLKDDLVDLAGVLAGLAGAAVFGGGVAGPSEALAAASGLLLGCAAVLDYSERHGPDFDELIDNLGSSPSRDGLPDNDCRHCHYNGNDRAQDAAHMAGYAGG